PRSVFAASFLGSANFIHGTIQTTPDGVVFTSEMGPTLHLRPDVNAYPVGPCLMAIRPEKIQLSEGPLTGENTPAVQVVGAEFLGDRTLYEVNWDGVLLDVQSSRHDLREGMQVYARIDAQDLLPIQVRGDGTCQ